MAQSTPKTVPTALPVADLGLGVLSRLIETSVAAMAPQRIFPSNKDIQT